MDLLFSVFVWIVLLFGAYHMCSNLEEYESDDDRVMPEGIVYRAIETFAMGATYVALVVMAGGIIWMLVVAYYAGAYDKMLSAFEPNSVEQVTAWVQDGITSMMGA